MSCHTASICVYAWTVWWIYPCMSCCDSECMWAVCVYCDLICALSLSPHMFVWSCFATALLIMSLAVRLMQQLIVALLAVGCYSTALNTQSFPIDCVWYELQQPLQTALIYRCVLYSSVMKHSHISTEMFYFTSIFFLKNSFHHLRCTFLIFRKASSFVGNGSTLLFTLSWQNRESFVKCGFTFTSDKSDSQHTTTWHNMLPYTTLLPASVPVSIYNIILLNINLGHISYHYILKNGILLSK